MSQYTPTVCGCLIRVCDKTGLNLLGVVAIQAWVADNIQANEIILTSYAYGYLCGECASLIGFNTDRATAAQLELKPGASDAGSFGRGLTAGYLMGGLR